MPVYFFDSHGNLYATCSVDHPEARAFGPTGASRRVHSLREVGLPNTARSAYAAAEAAGRVKKARGVHEWDTLKPSALRGTKSRPNVGQMDLVKELLPIRSSLLGAMSISKSETGRMYRKEIEVLNLLGPWTPREQEQVYELLAVDEFSRDEDSDEFSEDDDSDEY